MMGIGKASMEVERKGIQELGRERWVEVTEKERICYLRSEKKREKGNMGERNERSWKWSRRDEGI